MHSSYAPPRQSRLGASALRLLLLFVALLASFAIVSCGGGGGGGGSSKVKVSINPKTAQVVPGGTVNFSASVSGTSDQRVTWTASKGTISATGVLTAPASSGNVTVIATSVADPTARASATVTVASATGIAVSIEPGSATVATGAQKQFTATVTGSTNHAVTWTASAGSISSTGLFTAPSTPGNVTITATSAADATAKGSATVAVTGPGVSVEVSPKTVTLSPAGQQQFTASVVGSANHSVVWSTSGGSITASGLFTAPATAGTITVTATSVADAAATGTATVTVSTSGGISVTISPQTVSLPQHSFQTFTATVTGSSNQDVIWSATAGSISNIPTPKISYLSPDAAGTVTITAKSVADPSAIATATVNVSAVTVGISPSEITVAPNAVINFKAQLAGTTRTDVRWSASSGNIDSISGNFHAPSTDRVVTITATSADDPTASATAKVTVSSTLPSVTVTPTGASIGTNETKQFKATVTNAIDQSVTWTATGGTIDSNGLYKAGHTAGTYEVTATSVANPSSFSKVSVKVNPVTIAFEPYRDPIVSGAEARLHARVTGAENDAVNYTTSVGTVDSGGHVTLPAGYVGPLTVTATSAADPSATISATVTVIAATDVLYDFESGVPSAWSPARSETTPTGNRPFLGRFGGTEIASLTQKSLTRHTKLTVSFDVFVIGGWTGSPADSKFQVNVDGVSAFSKTFSNTEGMTQTYPSGASNPPGTGRTEGNTLGYTHTPPLLFNDTVYHVEFTVSHGASSAVLSFFANLAGSVSDVSWGIDNVRVRAVP